MAEPQAALLEAGRGPSGGTAALRPGAGGCQQRAGIEHQPHLLGVWRPVGRELQPAPLAQAAGGQGGEFGLDQSPFVVPLLGPWIGEQDLDLIERARA